MFLKEKAKAVKILIPALFLAIKKKETPLPAKILAAITIGYALSPIDLIPDFVPIFGYLDDLLVLPLLASFAIKLIPKEIMDQCKEEAIGLWSGGSPQKWYYGVPIILIWVLVIAVLIRLFI
jgi:Uncharacterized conserved protein